jgi:hypothetical protein
MRTGGSSTGSQQHRTEGIRLGQAIHEKLIEHKEYIERHGDDMPAISGWRWGLAGAASKGSTTTEGDNV